MKSKDLSDFWTIRKQGAVAAIARDADGHILMGSIRRIQADNAEEAEYLAAELAIKLAVDLNYLDVCLEGDSYNVIQCLRKKTTPSWNSNSIVESISLFSSLLREVFIKFTLLYYFFRRNQNIGVRKIGRMGEVKNMSETQLPEGQSTNSTGNSKSELESETKPFNKDEIIKVLKIVERDSMAIAESYTSLFSSLRLALSQVTSSSVDHMQCLSDAAGRIQESALDAATRGNHYINSCLRLNDEMKGVENLAMQLKILRRNVDAIDSAVNKLVRLP